MSNPLCLTEMRWRSISNKAIQSEVQLAGTCAYEVATHFSRCCSIWESVNLVALALFHGGTPILIQTWFSHLNAYASTCALHPNEYPNLARRWRSISNKAIQFEVQLAGTFAYAVATAGAVSSICASGHRWRAILLCSMAAP